MGRKAKARHCGLLLVDKPLGVTSHDVVGWVRWTLGEKVVGHCGTLDPAASGLLVLCVGPATRFVESLTAADKVYRARFLVGEATDSADIDGAPLERAQPSDGQLAALPEQLLGLVGPHQLEPPAYSAVKVDGVRAHERARRGETVELAARPMVVHAIEALSAVNRRPLTAVGDGLAGIDAGIVDATLRVSKGSYIRSLATELGRRLALPARLEALRRLASGRASLEHPACISGLVVERDARDRARIQWAPEGAATAWTRSGRVLRPRWTGWAWGSAWR